jgi:hypothetical protein
MLDQGKEKGICQGAINDITQGREGTQKRLRILKQRVIIRGNCAQARFKGLWPDHLVSATLISYLFFFGIGGFLHVSH